MVAVAVPGGGRACFWLQLLCGSAMMSGVTRFCSLSSICKIAMLEIAFMLAFWVGDYWPPFFGRGKKPCDVTNSSIVRKIVQKVSRYDDESFEEKMHV